MLPLLQAWAADGLDEAPTSRSCNTGTGTDTGTGTSGTSCTSGTSGTSGTTTLHHLSRSMRGIDTDGAAPVKAVIRKRNRHRSVMNAYALARTSPATATATAVSSRNRFWLDDAQNHCFRMTAAFAAVVPLEHVISGDALYAAATQTAVFMEQVVATLPAPLLLASPELAVGTSTSQRAAVAAAAVEEGVFEGDEGPDIKHLRAIVREESALLMSRCTERKKLQRFYYTATGRRVQRSRTRAHVQYAPIPSSASEGLLATAELRAEGVGGGGNMRRGRDANVSASHSAPVTDPPYPHRARREVKTGSSFVAWNRFPKPSRYLEEDPLVVAAAQISSQAGYYALQLCSNPFDVNAANKLYRELQQQLDPFHARSAVESQLPLRRLLQLRENNNSNNSNNSSSSSIAALLAAHDLGFLGKHAKALERYIEAYLLDDSQPLTVLCVATYLIMLATHPLIKHRHEVLGKGIAFLQLYVSLRRRALSLFAVETAHSISIAALEAATTPESDSMSQPRLGQHDDDYVDVHDAEAEAEAEAARKAAEQCFAKLLRHPETASSDVPVAFVSERNAEVVVDVQGAEERRHLLQYLCWEFACYEESLYNLGRAFHEMKLLHLAEDQYHKVFVLDRAIRSAIQTFADRKDTGDDDGTDNDNYGNGGAGAGSSGEEDDDDCLMMLQQLSQSITQRAAHNIVLIYKQSGALDLACDIMQTYLSF